MNAEGLISGRLRFKGKMATAAIAVSSLVMAVALAVSGGFRREIRDGVSALCGDITLSSSATNYFGADDPVKADSLSISGILSVEGIADVRPAVYRAGIASAGEEMCGVLIKGVPSSDTLSLSVSIPRKLSKTLRLEIGDDMLTYFIGEKVRVRKFKVSSVYDSQVEADGKLIVYASIDDMRRLNGWNEDEASVMEVFLKDKWKTRGLMKDRAYELGTDYVARTAMESYSALFDWLDLIDFNVLAILVLMTIVAGFNMISGLLILLFRSVSTIGLLKSVGMTDRSISKVFLRISSRIVLKGMLVGDVIAIVLCLMQHWTHLLKLDPSNYFVSYVPVDINLLFLVSADLAAYAVIMILLRIPVRFISKVDPSLTVRSE